MASLVVWILVPLRLLKTYCGSVSLIAKAGFVKHSL